MSPASRISLTGGKADRSRDSAFAKSRRPSAALNDNFVDICFFQQFAADGIEAGASQRTRRQALNMGAVDIEDSPDPGNAADQVYCPNRDGDGDDHDRTVGIDDLDGDFGCGPHIRNSRTFNKFSLADHSAVGLLDNIPI